MFDCTALRYAPSTFDLGKTITLSNYPYNWLRGPTEGNRLPEDLPFNISVLFLLGKKKQKKKKKKEIFCYLLWFLAFFFFFFNYFFLFVCRNQSNKKNTTATTTITAFCKENYFFCTDHLTQGGSSDPAKGVGSSR